MHNVAFNSRCQTSALLSETKCSRSLYPQQHHKKTQVWVFIHVSEVHQWSPSVWRTRLLSLTLWGGTYSICRVTSSLLLHLHHLVSCPPDLHPSSLEVTKLTLWRCWIQRSLLWSGCSGLLGGLEAGASFAAGGRGGHRCPGSEREASGGWW